MDITELVTHLVTQAAEAACFKAKGADSSKSNAPNTFKQVLKHPEKDLWLPSFFKEIEQLLKTKTLYFINRSSAPKKPVTNRWVTREKKDTQGQVVKRKARLIVRGFQQVPGTDFTETFAATSTPPTWRLVLALAAILDLEAEQVDFVGAFLNSETDVDLYMELPDGLYEYSLSSPQAADLLKQAGWDPSKDQVILLKKSLYGLKQAPYLWQQKLCNLLKSLEYQPLASDVATYYNRKLKIFVVSHVDDCLLVGPSIKDINALKKQLARVYDIEDLGPAQYFLGVEITRQRSERRLWLHQRAYITEAVEHFQLSTNGPKIPLSPGLTGPDTPGQPLNSAEKKLFQRLIGTAMYAATQTRPDIAFGIGWLSRQLQEPATGHLRAAKKLLSYLYSTRDLAIQYGPGQDLALSGYSDSDWAGCTATARSTYGYLFTVGGGPVSWKSKRASTVAYSTLEAEYTALIQANKEAQWLRGLFAELELPLTGLTPL
jgi:hypothetical protein